MFVPLFFPLIAARTVNREDQTADLPLRAELFSAVQMAQHGKTLASHHRLSTHGGADRLLVRLAQNATLIDATCSELTAAVKQGRQITPASEWLLDNFYLIEEQIRIARRHLPRNYSRQLPRLDGDALPACPRVYRIALEIIAHGDGRVDPESLCRFVAAYQEVASLQLGELWAIPIMLRLALIENLRRVAVRVADNRRQRDLANHWADQMTAVAETNPSGLILLVADMARSNPPITSAFVAELARRLQGQSPALTLALSWITHRLAEAGQTIEQQIQAEIQQQAADQVSIANSIGSLRFLGTMDWQEFVETMSVVEQTLRQDPAGVYAQMAFATRDLYRHAIEKIARRCPCTEGEVAQHALQLAQVHGGEQGLGHVGYYLTGAGAAQLERRCRMRRHWLEVLQQTARSAPLTTYLGAIAALALVATAWLLRQAALQGVAPLWLILTGVLTLLASGQLALALVNWLATLLTQPHPLPRMALPHGVPSDARTLVVVPALLYSSENVTQLCEQLEVHFLANRDPHLQFCLLTDLTDADAAVLPGDAALIEQAQHSIAQLNRQYAARTDDGTPAPFLLLHRPRVWNAQQGVWMGYERKRGKLQDLNRLLRAAGAAAFSVVEGDTGRLAQVRYVITLDSDTRLPREAALQMIATMLHPLNQPRVDPRLQRVVEGYGILQPRVAVSLPGEQASLYEKLCGGEPGIDPYTRTVSDVYQDVFFEGSFIGKGIYDVTVFQQVLDQRLPENRILSHDLLEGCYLRAGLLSDVQLYEAYPARYGDDVQRRQRWIRGDWQVAAWLRRRVPLPERQRERNPLSLLSRWKLFDNLRRSATAPALLGLLLLAWLVLPQPWLWSGAVLAVLFATPLLGGLYDLARRPRDTLWRQHVRASLRRSSLQFAHALLMLVFLPYEAWFSLDAIARSHWRLLVSGSLLLEWRASTLVAQGGADSWRSMWPAPVLALLALLAVLLWQPASLWPALLFVPLWLLAPALANRISQPIARRSVTLTPEQLLFLRALARRTWAYFERYVGPEDNWLPPDNMQEHPVQVVAHRTSPTNIGMALLANLSACDFGYLTVGQLIERTANTMNTLERMERYQGHFYNWYDTRNLQPLLPMYVSTVDSGNLAGHLLTLQAGLYGLATQPVLGPRLVEGLVTTAGLLQQAWREQYGSAAGELSAVLQATPDVTDGAQLRRWLLSLQQLLGGLDPQAALHGETLLWHTALLQQCRAALAELALLMPWLTLPAEALLDSTLLRVPSLRELAALHDSVHGVQQSALAPAERERQLQLAQLCAEAALAAQQRISALELLAQRCAACARMEYGFLYNATTHLLAIGYNVSERRLDSSYYDLLASEVRLASFVAIAQGQLPQEHWFALGRQLCIVAGQPVLLSWSGSMFEYLMPLLVMPSYPGTLLDQTYRAVIAAQIDYGRRRNVPWGISESGYNMVDASLNYQYRAFGVPGLGLKRGLGDDLVVAPYACMLGLMVQPEAACSNLQKMAAMGYLGRYGFYEAVDYTAVRLPRGQTAAVIRSFMVHHQGMGLLALAYLLHERPMQRRFESDPLLQSTLLLLQERSPQLGAFYSNTTEQAALRANAAEQSMPMRILKQHSTAVPETQLLSNGRYHVMVTNAGGSYSRWKDMAVTRWREDSTRDHWGNFCYVRDLDDGQFWSTTYQPTLVEPRRYEVIFSEGRAEFRRNERGIELYTEIVVSPEDDIELRRTRITNQTDQVRTLEVTSYAEVALAPAAADAAHPAFSKLFVQSEILHSENAILCTRRPRGPLDPTPWLLHAMMVHDGVVSAVSFETDRSRFLGRGRSAASPAAMSGSATLSGAEGSVLDPAVAIRQIITLQPEQTVVVDIVTGMCEQREAALHLIDKYQDRHLADRVFELAWTHSQVVLRQLNASEADAQLYARLANAVIYPHASLRADAAILMRNQRGQSGLWAYAISGDLPIVLLQIRDPANIELARQMVQAHAYWRLKGLVVDLVIWYEDQSGYRQLLHDQIMGLIASGIDAQAIDRPGGIFVRLVDQIANEDRVLLQSVARAILSDQRGTLAEQIKRAVPAGLRMPLLQPEDAASYAGAAPTYEATPLPQGLLLANGMGGFSADGREYVIVSSASERTPAPWSNVLANPQFGSVISESGQAYSWHENAHEFRLTPWHNDPVSDSSGEAFYIRDEQSGQFWSPTPLPAPSAERYVTRHGFGYSSFEHHMAGIASTLTTFVAIDAPIRYTLLRVKNLSATSRRLSLTAYVEWVLGDMRAKSGMHLLTEVDGPSGALFARNPYNTEFTGRVAFFNCDAALRSHTADRSEFIGRNGTLAAPAAMRRLRLSGKTGAGLDACAALMVPVELLPGQERVVVFVLGVAGRRNADASTLVQKHRSAEAAYEALAAVQAYWQTTLGAVQIRTPEAELDVLVNGWLMYQTIACRMWARSGYYQSGGAFGFRDQLQDAMATIHTRPALLREQLLLCAAHQFLEGDVQHWWHPPSDRGVRTHCSDDYLWLPLAAARYVQATGDYAVLDELQPYLEGRAVKPEEDSYYDLPLRSAQQGTLYEHCQRAIRHGWRLGEHDLPLIGSCDWNDGMDKVGEQGRGESIWLAFFQCEVLQRFAEVAEQRQDAICAAECRTHARALAAAVEQHGWDGRWYRRAYFDDGSPLGSHLNEECQIDSISQSWGVLSGAADAARAREAMTQVNQRLVRREDGIIQLLQPPFDKAGPNPGYIRGYVPGVRENGGQYTHAAIWTAMAFARLGETELAWELARMINPLQHTATPQAMQRYRVEPYVVTADVYAVAPHVGRGGWSWYTGSSGWMYRLLVESLLGLRRTGNLLELSPRMPAAWPHFELDYCYGAARYVIRVQRSQSDDWLLVQDGERLAGLQIALQDQPATHTVDVYMPRAASGA
ncbi:GH36-type glycosyl hydrolase domain-containing protein [Duganella qianjiadongensis]|uniref:Cyclic beta 1-2 glucan synthetase n=1 Tax=Duganella qianjiadongensis TaxID=2692176 RepID=A0ABW9VRG8_9BURK|nr:cyclic beta 1-2 glucan synthetase [Duganella qianjiadongensis]